MVGLLTALVSTAAAGPSPGGRYDGTDATGLHLWLGVAADGKRVSRYLFQTRIPCTDGKRRLQGLLPKGEGVVAIDANGAFTYTTKPQRADHPTRRGKVFGRFTFTVTGAFSPAGDVVTGTIDTTFDSKRFDCGKGPIAFTAHLDGTPGAPWRDATLATGKYVGSARGIDFTARVLAPGRTLLQAEMHWTTRCANGDRIAERHFYEEYAIRGGRVRGAGPTRARIGPGKRYRASYRTRLTLRFTGGADYRVSGRWQVTAVIRRDGAYVTTCRLDRRFAGAFVSGPG